MWTLEEHCTKLHAQILAETSTATQHLKQGVWARVKTLLQMSQRLETELEKREAQLLNLQQLRSSLDSTQL